MKSNVVSQELDQYYQELSRLRNEMDGIIRNLGKTMPLGAASWMHKEVQRQIRENSLKVEMWNIEKMGNLKRKLDELIHSLPAIVNELLKNKADWPHHSEAEWDNSKTHDVVSSNYIEGAFSQIVDKLGNILHEFDLLDFTDRYPTWIQESDGGFHYSVNLIIDQIPELKVREYEQLYEQYLRLGREIRDCQKRLSVAKVEELWEAA